MALDDLLLATLAVWRVTHLLQAEDGPWDLSARLRHAAGPGFWGRLLDCFLCLSLWVAAPFAWLLGSNAAHAALCWPALSAGAILLERVTAPAPLPIWKEESDDVVLRSETK